MIEEFVEMLDIEDSDFWYDVRSDDARLFIDRNATTLLRLIEVEWKNWNERTQEHLAYILDGGSCNERKILNEMEKSIYSYVAFRARECLRSGR